MELNEGIINEKEKISLKEKVTYGFGDLASNLLFTLSTSYLMYFYTDVAGIGIAVVGTIMLLARIVDAITDPMMGAIIDRTNSKYGKARPYLLWMAIPFGIVGALTFFSPDTTQQGKVIYAFVTYIAFCVLYTAVNIPYSTMMSSLTDDENERLSFNMFKSLGASIGQFIVAGCTLGLVAFLGQGNELKGFSTTVMIYGIVGSILIILCFLGTKERVISKKDKISLKDTWSVIKTNQPWVVLSIMSFLMFTSMMMKTQSTMYYAQYYLKNASIVPVLLSISSLVAIPIALVIPSLAKKIGKRNCIILGCIFVIIGNLGIYLSKFNVSLVIVNSVISAIGYGIAIGITFVMSAETVDYGEWKTGIRSQGMLFALGGFMVKLGMAVSASLSTFILSRGGYVPNAVQTQSAINAINVNYIWIPIIISIAIIIIAQFYKLDDIYRKVIEELRLKRSLVK
ncbi:MFS transporter [Clostridium massiliamazoniense]|uniref:MFS transporter n=1 Tax=Clostridium massiliamazoniense TaxID=1347366 RepID=UPI0006D81109|nr:MFS transporter [Clostridium massiliamazoniense]